MKTFKKFSKQKNRSNRFSWDHDDLEHHGIKESLEEKKQLNQFSSDKGTHKNPRFIPANTYSSINNVSGFEHNENGFIDHHESLSDDHIHHLRKYKEDSEVNPALRNHDRDYMTYHDDHIDALDHITSHKLDAPMRLFRGQSNAKPHHFPVGHEFTDHGYTSTSTSKQTASGFSYNSDNPKGIIHVIHAPKGTKGHYFDHEETENDHENEIVLHRGTRFKVTHHEADSQYHYIHSRVISQRGNKADAKPKIKITVPDNANKVSLQNRLHQFKKANKKK